MLISVTYAAIEAIQAGCSSAANNITSCVTTLNQQLAALVGSWSSNTVTVTDATGTWTGTAADAYKRDQSIWNGKSADLVGLIQRISTDLGTINTNYHGTETVNTNIFNG